MPVDDGFQGNGNTNVPVPDPSLLTTQQLNEGINNLKELIGTRLDAMDHATDLRLGMFAHVPSQIKDEVTRLRDLHGERFNSQATQTEEKFKTVTLQFEERDKRGERESRDNKVAVDAAFAAQKEAASEQNKSNTLAISKSETATAETINKLEQLVSANIVALNDKVDDIKATVGVLRQELLSVTNSIRQEIVAFQSRTEGSVTANNDRRSDNSLSVAATSAILSALAIAVIITIAIITHK